MATINDKLPSVIFREDDGLYLQFAKHRESFSALLEAGVFTIQSGKVVIDIHNGQVQNVHIDQLTYKRKSVDQKP